jgi:hypothetical protein
MRSQLCNRCKNSVLITSDLNTELFHSVPPFPIPHERMTGSSHPMPTIYRTHSIYLHAKHLTSYSYVTTHLSLLRIHRYNSYFLLPYNTYCTWGAWIPPFLNEESWAGSMHLLVQGNLCVVGGGGCQIAFLLPHKVPVYHFVL